MKVTHTKSKIIQYNEYYPFGLQASTSWTRENTYGNAYLYNEGSELNSTTGWYEMFYRGYNPALGRMFQVDPFASSFSSLTPYTYAGSNPVIFNDPSGGYMLPQRNPLNPDVGIDEGNMFSTPSHWLNPRESWENQGRMGFKGGPGSSAPYLDISLGVVMERDQYGRWGYWVKESTTRYFIEDGILYEEVWAGLDYRFVEVGQHTQKELIDFIKSNFGSAFAKYGESWNLDTDGKFAKGGNNLGFTRRINGKMESYIHPDAFRDYETLYMTIGHEFVHRYLIGSNQMDIWSDLYGSMDASQRMSEFYAHAWNVQIGHILGFHNIASMSMDRILEMFNPASVSFYNPYIMDAVRDVHLNGLDIWNR